MPDDPYAGYDVGGKNSADPYAGYEVADASQTKPKSYLDRVLERAKAQGEKRGKKLESQGFWSTLASEAGNVALPGVGSVGDLVKQAREVLSDTPDQEWAIEKVLPRPTMGRAVKGMVDPLIGAVQLGSHLVPGEGSKYIDQGVDAYLKFYDRNMDKSLVGELAGGAVTFGGEGAVTTAKTAGERLLRIAKASGKGASIGITTPEGNIKNEEDYWKRKGVEATIGAGIGAAIQGAGEVMPIAKSVFLQKLFGVTPEQKSKAARRLEELALLNRNNGTNLEASIGQLTDNPALLKTEDFSTRVWGGMTKPRTEQNAESLKMMRKWQDRLSAERDATPFLNEDALKVAAEKGGIEDGANPKRILDLMEEAGQNNSLVAGASREGKLWGQLDTFQKLDNITREMSGNAPINTDRLLEKIRDIRATSLPADPDTARAVVAELNRIEAQLVATRLTPDRFVPGNPTKPTENMADPLVGARRLSSYDQMQQSLGNNQQSAGSWVGGKFSEVRNGYNDVDSIAARLGELAEENALTNKGASKVYGVLRRTAKSELYRHAEQTGNPNLSEAQRTADWWYAKNVAPNQEGTFANMAGRDTQEGLLSYFINNARDGRAEWLNRALDPKGQAAARSWVADEALRLGQTRGNLNRDILSSAKAASSLENPNINPFFKGDKRQELDALREILRATEGSGQMLENPNTGQKNVVFHLIEMAKKGAGGVASIAGLGPGARRLFSTPEGIRAFLEVGKLPEAQREIALARLLAYAEGKGISEASE